MAHDSVLHARLRFLNEAAHLTAIRSPTASAAISQARDRLLVVQDADLKLSRKDWDTLRREVCGAHPKHIKKGTNPKMHLTPAAETSESRDGKVTKSANATSKQRAKARKGGLQALLTQNKSQTEGLGLDLMDFMK
ncbi:hypothetical protein P154DRAFT_487823 [Amniculicola lignicola CBS 123094]|uniref:Uncharacterized protein n=1 Tax=Amniculicola lignicola CBS 123094 TaxID=1392246 RepID=A0A6A5WPP9_9PLEO|nr:hypothetical protein P154DRAFT_487823 [Amniculicola lignicola CBS 123094]